MGKGDIKSKRGKIVNGSFGVRRRRKKADKDVLAAVMKAPVNEDVKETVKAAVKKKEKAK
jgi:ribosomal small subunit protein bTHX